MRAVARQVAFEQDEAVDREGVRHEVLAAVEEALDLARPAAFPAGERDVRMERSALGLEAGADAGPLDLRGERGDRLLRVDGGP